MSKDRDVRIEDSLRRARGGAFARSLAPAAVLAALFTFEGNTGLGQTQPPPETSIAANPTVHLRGFVDVYADWNPNRPAATSFDAHWSGQLWLLNGWQNIEDNNDAKAFATQVAYAKDALGLTLNTFFGPELPDDDAHWAVTGAVGRRVFSSTLTFETRPHPQVILKVEGRYDRSSAGSFGGPDGPLTKRDEFLLVLGAVATF